MKRNGTRAETRFRLSLKRTSPFKLAGVSVQSTAGSRVVRISGSNAGFTMFRGGVKVLHSPISPPVRHRVPSGFDRTIHVWMVAKYSANIQTGPGEQTAAYIVGTWFLPGVNRQERDVDHSPHLPSRLKKV